MTTAREKLSWMGVLRAEAPLFIGFATYALFLKFGDAWLADDSRMMVRALLLVWLIAVIMICIFAVVRHADHLADMLGEPLGTLVLTMSVIVIEVALIAAVMFEGAENPTLARDTMFAVIMIMMNGMVGLALLAGGILHVQQDYNLEGARAYLAVLVPLTIIALVMPNRTISSPAGTMSALQAVFFTVATLALYAVFLGLQTMRHRGFFLEPAPKELEPTPHEAPYAEGGRGILIHSALLFATMIPIVGLADYLAVLVQQGIGALGVPTAIGGILIAALILGPESIAAFEAAIANRLQRSINLCLGSALSTVALTIPFVVIIELVHGHPVTLGLNGDDTVLLALTILVSMITFSGTRTNMLQGVVHLLIFFTYIVLVFSP